MPDVVPSNPRPIPTPGAAPLAPRPGLAERSWPGKYLRIGPLIIAIDSLRGRCIMTTIDPDTGEQNLDVLRRINRHFDGQIALNSWVPHGAIVHTGDKVELFDTLPTHLSTPTPPIHNRPKVDLPPPNRR